MASVRSVGFAHYCDRMYSELNTMKSKLAGFVTEIENMRGPERELLASHVAHFRDLEKTIDWKLEILTKACPFEWSGDVDVEKTASVHVDEELSREQRVSGGYGGG